MRNIAIAIVVVIVVVLSISAQPLLDTARATHYAEEIEYRVAGSLARNMINTLLPILLIPSNETITLLRLLIPAVLIEPPSIVILNSRDTEAELSVTRPQYTVYPENVRINEVTVSHRYVTVDTLLVLKVINVTSYLISIKPLNNATTPFSSTECVVNNAYRITRICKQRIEILEPKPYLPNISLTAVQVVEYSPRYVPTYIARWTTVNGRHSSATIIRIDYHSKSIEILPLNTTLHGDCIAKLLDLIEELPQRIAAHAIGSDIEVDIDVDAHLQCRTRALRLLYRGHGVYEQLIPGVYIAKTIELTNGTLEVAIDSDVYRALAPAVHVSTAIRKYSQYRE